MIPPPQQGQPVAIAIAPAPPAASSFLGGSGQTDNMSTMPYACQDCTRRKIKCDKKAPQCSGCRKSKLECVYQAPPPRRKGMMKRKLDEDVNEKLARYERILQEHDLLPKESNTPLDTPAAIDKTTQSPPIFHFTNPETANTGKLVTGQGKTRLINSNLWRNLGEEEIEAFSEEDEDEVKQVSRGYPVALGLDPLSGQFMGSAVLDLLAYHPNHDVALRLWHLYHDNVEPLVKVLHSPSTYDIVNRVSQQPALASKPEECLLFAIYHFAVFSLSDEDCLREYQIPRAELLEKYHFAVRQALVNASFLRTTEISVLQALVLLLLVCRYSYDPNVYWILTGVAVRIAQRMGLHRDGEELGLPPFDVQMRRRLFFQLIPLDGIASQMSGTGIALNSLAWDCRPPLNLNDADIWPGMTETPVEQKGATEMIFCLARICVGKVFAMRGSSFTAATSNGSHTGLGKDKMIDLVENEVESNFIRYCDLVEPLHFMTVILARAAIISMRLQIRMPKVRDNTITKLERRELFHLTQRILDTDIAAYAQTSLKRFMWQTNSFFVWGSWDSLIFTITNIPRADFLTPSETDAAWSRVEKVYGHHSELIESKQQLHATIRRITLQSWDTKPPTNSVPEPNFIAAMRLMRKAKAAGKSESDVLPSDSAGFPASMTPTELCGSGNQSGMMNGPLDMNLGEELPWEFWEQLMRNNDVQSSL